MRVSYRSEPGLWKQRYLSYHRTSQGGQEALEAHLRAGTTAALATTWGDVYAQWQRRSTSGEPGIHRQLQGLLGPPAGWRVGDVRVTIDDLQRIIDQDEAAGLSKSSITNDNS